MEIHDFYLSDSSLQCPPWAVTGPLRTIQQNFLHMPKRRSDMFFSHKYPLLKLLIYFSYHLHVTSYKTHIMLQLNMHLLVTPNFVSLNAVSHTQKHSVFTDFPSDSVFYGHTKQLIITFIFQITYFQIAVRIGKEYEKAIVSTTQK